MPTTSMNNEHQKLTSRPDAGRHSCVPLPYHPDPCVLYERLRVLDTAVLLDSGDNGPRGRFDILAAQPDTTRSLIVDSSCSGPSLLESLRAWQDLAMEQVNPSAQIEELPFAGGYIGYLSYELGRRLRGLPPVHQDGLPIAVAHYYPWAIVQDHKTQSSWLVGEDDAVRRQSDIIREILKDQAGEPLGPEEDFRLTARFTHPWSLDDYRQPFERVKNYIADGDCYQINIGQPFSAPFSGDLFAAYRDLRKVAKAPFSGFFPLSSEHSLLCLSPERFLTVDQGKIETRPIKGTRPRYDNPSDDAAAAKALLSSEKERAENLMIVDLLRNDIGQFCTPGTVRAEELFSLESYSTVHHLVSAVTGELSQDCGPLELLLGCMPGGSITGAPKHRAMQIIDELEPAPRQLWCGSLFYLSRHGRLDSNITIRTLFNQDQRIHCWAGGGLVNDSELGPEYQEQRDKVGVFMRTLEDALAKTPSQSPTDA